MIIYLQGILIKSMLSNGVLRQHIYTDYEFFFVASCNTLFLFELFFFVDQKFNFSIPVKIQITLKFCLYTKM